MLETGEAKAVGEAARAVGISRSAFYKYKDAVRPFNDMMTGRIVTLQCLLKDEPGVLSSILAQFATSGANILTINQSIPTNGCAAVTIAAETGGMGTEIEEMLRVLRDIRGVVRCEILAG
jgi:chorismate mutase